MDEKEKEAYEASMNAAQGGAPEPQPAPAPAPQQPAGGYTAAEAYRASMDAAQGGAAWGSPATASGAPVGGAPYGGQPPVPPAAPGVYGYEPPRQPQQKRRWPWFLLGLAVGLLVGLGGCVSCAGVMAASTFDRADSAFNYAQPAVPEDSFGIPSPDDDFSYGYGDEDNGNDGNGGNGNGGNDGNGAPTPDGSAPSSTEGTYSLDEIKSVMFPNGAPENVPGADGACLEGVYTVGPNGQIPAGLYFLQGAEDAESNFYVFNGTNAPNYYTVDDSVVYFGNYFTQLDEGDLIVFKPGAAGLTMIPAPDTAMNVKAPYNDGCYRVGIDIPAGSYTITAFEPSYQVATNDPGAFVMNDLDFGADSIAESVYVIPGGKQVVTVKDGQYLELFAATATPVSQG